MEKLIRDKKKNRKEKEKLLVAEETQFVFRPRTRLGTKQVIKELL